MKFVLLSILISSLFLAVLGAKSAGTDDKTAIQGVIEKAYVKGIHTKFDEAAILSGFHPQFIMFVKGDNGISHVSITDWVARMKASVDPDAAPNNVRYEMRYINIEQDTAGASLKLFKDDKHIFTDSFLLYKIDGEWKIIGKVFHRYQ